MPLPWDTEGIPAPSITDTHSTAIHNTHSVRSQCDQITSYCICVSSNVSASIHCHILAVQHGEVFGLAMLTWSRLTWLPLSYAAWNFLGANLPRLAQLSEHASSLSQCISNNGNTSVMVNRIFEKYISLFSPYFGLLDSPCLRSLSLLGLCWGEVQADTCSSVKHGCKSRYNVSRNRIPSFISNCYRRLLAFALKGAWQQYILICIWW